ncbi:hypothetical protein GCM10027446_33190 [Angustibacter peucedani]
MSQRLPLFPLGTVLVPGEVLPLHVFEPRYLDLVRDLLAGDAQRFGVVAIRQGHEVGAGRLAALYDVGCAAEVLEVDHRDDGSVDLVTVGRERFRLDQLDPDAGTRYLTGRVEWVDEPADPVDPDLAGEVRAAFAEYCDRLGLGREAELEDGDGDGEGVGASALDDPTLLSYVVTGSMLLHLPERQALLAARDATARLRRALGLLVRERTLWQVAPSVPAVDLARLPADPR